VNLVIIHNVKGGQTQGTGQVGIPQSSLKCTSSLAISCDLSLESSCN